MREMDFRCMARVCRNCRNRQEEVSRSCGSEMMMMVTIVSRMSQRGEMVYTRAAGQ